MSMPAPSDEPVFNLRCRDAEWVDRPATLAEFSEPAAAADPHRGLTELLIADMVARTQTELAELLAGRVLLTCESPRFGIPVGVVDLDAPALDDWRMLEQIDLELLDGDREGRLERSVAAQFRRGLIAVAGALPLLVSPILAHAHAPPEPGLGHLGHMVIGFAPPPKLPEDDNPNALRPVSGKGGKAGEVGTLEPPSASPDLSDPFSPSQDPSDPSSPSPDLSDPFKNAQQGAAPAPRINADNLSLTGTNVWTGLLGKRVKLTMKNEQTLDGTILAQSTRDLAVARTSDGTVVSVPKAEVAGVRLELRSPALVGGGSDVPIGARPPNNAHRLHGGGAAMIGIGAAAALAGTVVLGIYPSYLFISLPLLLPGLAMIGGGASLMVSAGKKRRAFNRAWGIPETARLQMVPTLSASRNGGQAGMVLRF